MGAAEATMHDRNENADVLQAMNQQQLASSTQILTQDVNRLGTDIATSAGATQTAIANGTLQQTVATLQGQAALSGAIGDSTVQSLNSYSNILQSVAAGNASTAATINNAQAGISNDIRNALGVIDADMHSMDSNLSGAIESVRNDANRNYMAQLAATHAAEVQGLRSSYDTLHAIDASGHATERAVAHAEIQGLKSSYDTLRAIDDSKYATERAVFQDGTLTRNLITQNAIADRDRMIIVAENKLAEALADHRVTRSTNDIIINNNNNNNLMAQQLVTQQQQQAISALVNGQSVLASGLGHITSHLANITNVSVNASGTGTGGGTGRNGNGGS
jgi:hypothetical protein